MSERTEAAIVSGGENAAAAPLCAGCKCIAAALAEIGESA